MIKKLLLSFGILLLLIFHSCKKDKIEGTLQNNKGVITLSEARSFFETEVMQNSKLSMAIKKSKKKLSTGDLLSDSKINDLLYKKPLWDKAYSKGVNNGTALAIPIHFDVKSYIRTRGEYGVDFDNLNYLLITKSPEGAYTAEWITLYPDMEWIKGNRETYTGRIVVADWDGNIKSSYGFEKSGKISFNTVSRFSQTTILNSKSSSKSATTEVYKAIDGKCYENIREVPDATGVTLYRKEVDCPDDNKPDFSNNGGSADPNRPGGGGSLGGGNYPPPNCNSDPNYVVPTGPAPDGKAYMPRCEDPVKEEPIVELQPELMLKDPCDDAKSLGENQDFKDIIATLKGLTNEKNERGYTYKINSDGIFTKTELAGENGAEGIDFNVNGSIDGYAHTHYAGLLSIFSVSDIYAMTLLYKSGKMPINFTATVVTASGTTYMLKVQDIYKFYDFASNIRGTIKDVYENIYADIYKISPNNSVEANEKAFLQYLEITNSGLKLFKANPNTGAWEPKKVDDEGKIVNNPC
jgi:hypothetical protein